MFFFHNKPNFRKIIRFFMFFESSIGNFPIFAAELVRQFATY